MASALFSGALSRRGTALLLLVAGVAGLAVTLGGAGRGLEGQLRGVRDAIRQHSAAGRFVLVEIDARSLARLDHWPWPRPLHVTAIKMLERAGANTIAFDVDFSARSTPAQDMALAHAIDHARVPIILPTFRQAASQTSSEILENLPLPDLRRHAQLAAVNIEADEDGLVHSYPYGVVTGGVPRPSIGAMLAGSAGEAGTAFPIDGAIDPATIPRISYVDLVQGRVPPSSLRGKIALVGATAIELGDLYPVPRYGVLPGPVIQLLAAETLRNGSAPIDHGPILPIALSLLALWAAARYPRARIVTSAIGFVLLLTLPLATEALKLGSPTIVPALATLVAGWAVLTAAATVASLRLARTIDAQSGLPNRRGFEEVADPTGAWGLAVVRIDSYSDTAGILGHAEAGAMIARIVDRLQLAGADIIYRLEDSVLGWMARSHTTDRCIDQIEAIANLLRPPVEVAGRHVELRCSFGLAEAKGEAAAMLADHAILAADHALDNGEAWALYNSTLEEEQDWRLTLAGELDQALGRGDIWVAYQPKLDIRRGAIVAAEALVRWRHPTRGAIPPDAFIPALEASGRILDLTLFVLHQAVADALTWHRAGLEINVAVNVSALLASETAFLTAVERLVTDRQIAPTMLTLEVTESATLIDADRAISALEKLSGLGIKLSIDDYGTGQSTLTYLKRLPASEIKIDKGFVLNLESNRSDQAMVRSTIELAHELGYTVVAEGVETAAVLEHLTAMGCDTAQGWHIGKPMAADVFAQSLGRKEAA